MHVPLWVWGATIAAILMLLVFDFFAHVRTPHEPSLKEAGGWSIFYVVIALIFGAGLWAVWGHDHGIEYFAGYVTEKSLSVANLFVFVIIMAKFAVPRVHQQKALLIGIVIALIMRGIFIAVGAAANLTWYHPAQVGSETKVSAAENHPEYAGRTTEFTGRGAVLGTLLG